MVAEEAWDVSSQNSIRDATSTKFGICAMPLSIRKTVRLAVVSEEFDSPRFGVGDGHFLHHDLYPVITAALLYTNSIRSRPIRQTPWHVTGPFTLPPLAHSMSCAQVGSSSAWRLVTDPSVLLA